MATDNFLVFPQAAQTSFGSLLPIGQSQDPTHKGAIEVQAFAFGIENPTTIGSSSSGAGAGKSKFDQLDITKSVDSASPTLYSAVASGAHFPQMLLKIRRAGTTTAQADYLIYDFRLVFVSKVEWSGGGGGDAPEEVVSFVFGALEISYAAQTSTGTLGNPVKADWSQVTNNPTLNIPGQG